MRSHILSPSVARSIASICAAVLVVGAHGAQAGINVWTSHGPGVADVSALAIDPSTPSTLYAGTNNEGVFKSTNGGDTWNATNTGLPDKTSVAALAIDPNMPRTLYVSSSGGANGGGVYKSTDGGSTWRAANTGLPASAFVAALVIDDRTAPSTLYAAIGLGYLVGDGVYKSTDGGDTWNAANTGLPDKTSVSALAIDPTAPGALYAATSDILTGSVFKSADGGDTWNEANTGSLPPGVTALATDPTTPGTLYAGLVGGCNIAGCYSGSAFKSTDGGDTWNAANTDLPFVNALAIDLTHTIYAATTYGVFKSTNGARSWQAVNAGLQNNTEIRALAIDPTAPRTLYAAANVNTYDYRVAGGVFKSTDGAGNWAATNRGLQTGNTLVLGVAIDPTTPSTLYAATIAGVHKSTDGGANWAAINFPGLPLFDPTTPGTLYTAAAGGVKKSTDGGTNWAAVNFPGLPVFDPTTPTTLYAGAASVFKSTNNGDAWNAANTGLPDNTYPDYPDNISVHGLVIDPNMPGTLHVSVYLAVTGGSRVFKSTDGGDTWNAAGTGLPDHIYISTLAIDPTAPNTLYATTVGAVYKSTDGGDTWDGPPVTPSPLTPTPTWTSAPPQGTPAPPTPTPTRASTLGPRRFISPGPKDSTAMSAARASNAGLPESPVNALVIDPTTPSTLYAATYQGVYKSTDGASSWQAFNAGLSNTSVHALAIDPTTPRTLYAGTDGGGMFAIEQVAPSCVGDCAGADTVAINDLITLVNIALGTALPSTCPNGGLPLGGEVNVAVIIQAVNHALNGCGGGA